MATHASAGLARNVRLYPWYTALFNALFWMPVFFLFFGAYLTLDRVLQLEAIYYGAVVLLEVPSGYFSDRVGRRATLLVSAASLVAAYGLFFAGGGFAAFAIAQALLAAGIAFNSGTDTALHFDSLAALGRADEYAWREARAARALFVAGALAAVAGGAVGVVQLRYAYGLSLLAALGTLAIVLAFREPRSDASDGSRAAAAGFLAQVRACLAYLRQPALAWLFGFAVLMIVLMHLPYEFYQPYLELLWGRGMSGLPVPLLAGLHMAAAMMVGAWVAGRSVRVRDRWGTAGALLASGVINVAIIAAMGAALHPAIALLTVLRSVPRALSTAPLNAAVTPRIARSQRATYLSIQSLAGRLAFSVTLIALSWIAGSGAATDWPALARMLWASAVVGVVGLGVLGVAARRGRISPA